MRKTLLLCGILSSLLYVAMNIFIPMLSDGYSSTSQTVSELSAIGAPTRTIWVLFGFLYTFLMMAFGWGVKISAHQNRRLSIVGFFVFIYGIISLLWPFTPMHQREVIAAGGGTLTDTLHISMAMVTVLLMLLAMGFGADALGKGFRIFSIATMLTLFVFGILTSADAHRIDKNLPTPLIGVWERINIGVFLLWVIVLSFILLQEEKRTISTDIVSSFG